MNNTDTEMRIAKRFLVTTADERSWKFDRPVLFLGEWCRFYDRKHVWSNMDAVVAKPYGFQPGQREGDLSYFHKLSRQLLAEVTEALNTFHKTQHSERYWNIVLGKWLQRYAAVTFNRYFTLKQVLKDHGVSGTTVFDFAGYSLATNDSLSFVWACSDDIWNHVLYAKIINFLGNVKTDIDSVSLQGISGFVQEGNIKVAWKQSAKRFILNTAKYILPKFSRKRDAFIVNSYLPFKEEVMLQLGFVQCPQLWQSPTLEKFVPDPGTRRRFSIDAKNYTGFERFVRCQLSEIIPSCYLEGYDYLVQQVKSLPWPAEPRFILTSNNFDTDEIFKVWTALKVEEGRPYFTGQHGAGYGTSLGSQNWPEIVTCDKFFTWGWTNGNHRNIPAFVFTVAGRKPQNWLSDGGLLLVELHPPILLVSCELLWDDYLEFGIYQEEQFRFVAALPETIQQKLTVRLHHVYKKLRWSDEQRWKDFSPHMRIETGDAPIRKLVARSRVVVHSYNSAGILETLALNIPTMCFWHGGLDHLLPSAKPYYESLKNAGILADTPEQAAEMVSLHWDNISEWWESETVQDARKTFCDQYARTEKTPVRTMKRLLTTHAKIHQLAK
ncbi:MAG: LIC12162 family protein [Proteobacteria bacterium]|nr:LIC12162 family protein [Pseudomonadota bacterium]